MLNRIKTLCVLTVSLAVATASFGVTVTVGKTGTENFPTIEAALNSINYQDGQDDLVLIGPGVYDGQITPNGNAGANSTAYPNLFNMTLAAIEAAYASHTDRLTLRGSNPNDPPVLTYINGDDRLFQPYSVFPNNPVDFFEAGLSLVGNNVTFENVEIRMGTTNYGVNGQARGIVFNDCLFTQAKLQADGHSSWGNYNNNIEITSLVNTNISADNEYAFNNCIFDGNSTADGHTYNSTGFYFHGYGELAGKDPTDDPTFGFTHMTGCIFLNWRSNIHTATHQQGMYYRGLRDVIFEDNFSENVRQILQSRGANMFTVINRNVVKLGGFTNNGVIEPLERGFEITDRQSAVPRNVMIANNIFSGTSSQQQLRLNMNTATANAPQIGNWHVVNNTFHGAAGTALQVTGNVSGPGSNVDVTIANNIFAGDGNGAAIGIDYSAAGSHTVTLLNNGFFGNATDVNGALTNTGAVFADPQFDNEDITIPADTGGPIPVQGLNPTNAAYLNTGNQAAYTAIEATVGTSDVDQTHLTANIDIGAQQNEPISVLDWSIY